jgi:hypothetical protein
MYRAGIPVRSPESLPGTAEAPQSETAFRAATLLRTGMSALRLRVSKKCEVLGKRGGARERPTAEDRGVKWKDRGMNRGEQGTTALRMGSPKRKRAEQEMRSKSQIRGSNGFDVY